MTREQPNKFKEMTLTVVTAVTVSVFGASAKEVMFSALFVCLLYEITQTLFDKFQWHM